ncbi:hypothetical protein HT123_31935, partial [Pseudomonas sp. MAFF 301512]|nr:hypothetical protein [Pseudomonas allii]
SGYQSDSNIATIGGSNVLGKGHSYGVSAIYSLPAAGNWANSFSFGVDFKDFDEQMKFGASSDQVPLKYAPFTLGYNGFRYTEQSQLGLGLNLVVGTRASLSKWLSGSLDWGYPLLDGPNTQKQDSRLHFSVQATF